MSGLLHIRSASIDITPAAPCCLAGYDNRPGPFEEINDPLEASVIWLTQGEKQAVLIGIDTLFVTRSFKRQVIASVGLKEEDVFMIASHTHFAPALDPTKPNIGRLDPQYAAFVRERITGLLSDMKAKRPDPCTLHTGESATDRSINRRRAITTRKGLLLKKKIVLGPNPKGPAGKLISVLGFRNELGELAAVAWHFACHPTDFPKHNSVSAAFPGAVRQALRTVFGEIPVLFLQGFAGDVKPWEPAAAEQKKRSIKEKLINRDSFAVWDEGTFARWCGAISSGVLSALSRGQVTAAPLLGSKIAAFPLDRIFRSEAGENDELTLQELTLGRGLRLVSISAEPLMAYEEVVRKVYGGGTTLCCGYTDSVRIYLPTSRQVSEGGYECEGFQEKFSFRGTFADDLEEKIGEYLDRLKSTP